MIITMIVNMIITMQGRFSVLTTWLYYCNSLDMIHVLYLPLTLCRLYSCFYYTDTQLFAGTVVHILSFIITIMIILVLGMLCTMLVYAINCYRCWQL